MSRGKTHERGQVSDPINHLFIPAMIMGVLSVVIRYIVELLGLVGYPVSAAIALVVILLWARAAPIYPKERYDT